jgi:hypothetical protein
MVTNVSDSFSLKGSEGLLISDLKLRLGGER